MLPILLILAPKTASATRSAQRTEPKKITISTEFSREKREKTEGAVEKKGKEKRRGATGKVGTANALALAQPPGVDPELNRGCAPGPPAPPQAPVDRSM